MPPASPTPVGLSETGSSPAVVEPEHVMNCRGGSVLGKKTILKSDHFPGCQNKRLFPQIEGAPNYRQAASLRVHGVAIPTTDGIRNVLNHIGAQKNGKQRRVLWHNLREEPVVYINGRPFVLRDVERPFSNLEYTGINRVRVEQMEARLKEDIMLEASQYGNKILVTDELPDGQMVDQWEPILPDSVKTPLEVYEELQVEGYLIDYERVPITDEKSPKEQDFDILTKSTISHSSVEAQPEQHVGSTLQAAEPTQVEPTQEQAQEQIVQEQSLMGGAQIEGEESLAHEALRGGGQMEIEEHPSLEELETILQQINVTICKLVPGAPAKGEPSEARSPFMEGEVSHEERTYTERETTTVEVSPSWIHAEVRPPSSSAPFMPSLLQESQVLGLEIDEIKDNLWKFCEHMIETFEAVEKKVIHIVKLSRKLLKLNMIFQLIMQKLAVTQRSWRLT